MTLDILAETDARPGFFNDDKIGVPLFTLMVPSPLEVRKLEPFAENIEQKIALATKRSGRTDAVVATHCLNLINRRFLRINVHIGEHGAIPPGIQGHLNSFSAQVRAKRSSTDAHQKFSRIG